MPHLLVAVTAHGFGHVAQVAPVVNALRRRQPAMQLTLRTNIPRAFLASRFDGAFDLVPALSDFGMVMDNALTVNVPRSLAAYAELHKDWDRHVRDEAQALKRIAPDVILANVSYLTLAGAATASIPAYALSSLNWADIYRHYAALSATTKSTADTIHSQILAAYRSARAFLQTEPSMPMQNLPNRCTVGVVARAGVNRRAELDAKLQLSPGTRLVIIAAGGIELRLPLEHWQPLPSVHWLVSASWGLALPSVTAVESLNMHFTDLLRSCDALIGKPGYGTFSEAAVNGVPVLYTPRRDWPEEPYLVDWLQQHGHCLAIDQDTLERGDIAQPLQKLWSQPPRPRVVAEGIERAASLLLENWRQVPEATAKLGPDNI